jgi:hypothetical protein
MNTKTKIIFISTFIIVLLASIGIYLWINRSTVNENGTSPWYQSFNPFGTGENTEILRDDAGNIIDENGDIVKNPEITNSKFHQITDFAVSGASFFEETRTIESTEGSLDGENLKTSEQAPTIRFVERKNGHIYKMFLDTKIKEKISNSTIPNIYEAKFGGNGSTVLYRYLSEDNIINSFIAKMGEISGEFLPQNISDASISTDKDKLFYLTESNDGVVGTIETLNTGAKSFVFNHPFTEWLSDWDSKQNIYLTTKSSYKSKGSIFILNPIKKTLSKIFGGVDGLTTLISPDGKNILYSYTSKEGPKLGVFNIKEHTTKDLDTYGLSEKCIWSNDNIFIYCGIPSTIDSNEYPDLWYQGISSFDDFFVNINTISGERYTIGDSTKEKPLDATSLFLDKEEKSLFFINKKDSNLWSLEIK